MNMKRPELPGSPETERTVFGCVFLDNAVFAEIRNKPLEIFQTKQAQELFLAMKQLDLRGEKIDPLTVRTEAQKSNLQLASDAGIPFLTNMTYGLPHFSGIGAYVKILEDYAARRKVIQKARQLAERMYQLEDPTASLATFSTELEELQQHGELGRQPLVRFGDAIPAQVEEWNQMLTGTVTAIQTGLPEIDLQLTGGGYTKGMFHVIAGFPAMGKSSFAIDIAGNAVLQGKSVVYFTLELSREVFINRFLSPFADIPRGRIAPSWIKQGDVDRLTETAEALKDSLFFIDDQSTTVYEMEESLKQVAKITGSEIDVVIIDYIQRMSTTGDSEHHAIKRAVDRLAKLAKTYNSAVLALSQFSRRRPEDRFQRPVLDWLKESGSIGEAARTATCLWQNESQWCDYEALKEARRQGDTSILLIKQVNISVIKQGEGAEFDTDGFFNTRTMTFGIRQPLVVHRGETATTTAATPENELHGAGNGQGEPVSIQPSGNSGVIISSDPQGNSLKLVGSAVHLKLTTEPRPRTIGHEIEPGVFYCKRSRQEQLHRVSRSYGFNWHLVNSDRFHTYRLLDEFGEYVLPAEVVKQGKVMRFKDSDDENDYELQYFVPLDVIENLGTSAVATAEVDFEF